jgi:hypothetical protein
MNMLFQTLRQKICIATQLLTIILMTGTTACGGEKTSKTNSETASKTAVVPYAPPASSPLARKMHPRLFFTQEDLPALRQRLSTTYSTEFQRFVTELDKHFDELPEKKEGGLVFFDTKNYAFLYMIDPAQMPGFSFGHTREQYGRKAIELAMYVKKETRGDRHSSANLQGQYGGYHNLALAVAYDWTFPLLTMDEKRLLADSMIRLYEIRDKDASPGAYEKLSNQVTGYIHSGSAAALALWGDDLGPQYTAKAQEMLDYFNAVFLERSLEVGDKIFEGPGWGEGASYYMLSITNISFLAGAASSALGENLFFKHDFLRRNILYLFYNILPLKLRDDYYFSRHDTNSLDDILNHNYSRIMAISAGALRKDDPQMAGFARWMLAESGFGQEVEDFRYFDPRIDYLFFKFLWGSKEVTPLSPEAVGLPLTCKLGLGEIVMRSSFDKESSTHIIFWAPKYWYSPHAHLDFSSFTIYKYGSLALDAGNAKNADEMPRCSSAREAIFHNILGLYDPQEVEEGDLNFMDFSFSPDKSAEHWKDEGFKPGGRNVIGEIRALESGEDYDYIDYDYSPAYGGKKAKASAAHRRFVYLRGPENHEFVIIHDLVESPLEKRWLLHTAFEPEINGDQITVTNNYDVAHGRMLVKSLLPAQKEILKIGGEGQWFVDADWKFIKSRGPYTDWGAYWTGSWRAEIRSSAGEFLTVMQIGDSRTLQSMSPVTKIESPVCAGVLVEGRRLVVFNKKAGPQNAAEYEIDGNQSVAHVAGGLMPDGFAKIKKNGKFLLNVKTSATGILNFTDNPGGTARYEVSF